MKTMRTIIAFPIMLAGACVAMLGLSMLQIADVIDGRGLGAKAFDETMQEALKKHYDHE